MTSPAPALVAGLCLAAAACARDSANSAAVADDSTYAAVQERGAGVMGVDQYTSQHVFEDLPDGGRIVLDRDDPSDTAAIATIRAHMREIVTDFRAGEFARPFAVHAMTVPGTDVMSERRAHITYEAADRPSGAEVRITTADSTAIQAIHAFLAFQSSDHRAPAHEGH